MNPPNIWRRFSNVLSKKPSRAILEAKRGYTRTLNDNANAHSYSEKASATLKALLSEMGDRNAKGN